MIRQRALSALIVGATGVNVLHVVTAFESRGIVTIRTNTIAAACERIAIDMPHVVLVLVPYANDAERDGLADRALAVGALVVQVDPALDGEAFKDILESAVVAALERKLLREQAEAQAQASAGADTAIVDEIDDGWGE